MTGAFVRGGVTVAGRRRVSKKRNKLLTALILCWVCSACAAPVDIVRLTSEAFPSKESPDQVAVLHEKPARPYRELAELSVHSDMLGFERLQREILEHAAKLGADGVVFAEPEKYVKHEVGYEPVYGPWDAYGPYSGLSPWAPLPGAYGPGFGGVGYGDPYEEDGVPVQYDVTIKALKGIAVRYAEEPKQ